MAIHRVPALRRALGGLALALIVAGAIVVPARPASAHTDLALATPAPGSILAASPAEIKLRFTESVTITPGAVRVYDTNSQRVDNGGDSARGNTVRMALPQLENGSYVVTWRVVSADSHPIRGAFTFQVGEGVEPSATSRKVLTRADRLLVSRGGDATVGAVYGVTRALVFLGLALLLGGVFFVAVIDPSARTSPRARRVIGLGFLLALVGAALGLWVYGPYAAGLSSAGSFALLGDALGTRFGQVGVARLALLAIAAALTGRFFARPATPRWWYWVAGITGLALSATPAAAGHARTGDWVPVALITDTLHVSAMSLWIGGLVVLAAVTLTRFVRAEMPDPPAVLGRFSKLAMTCVGVLIVTGAFQTWRQVGSLDELRSTDYGRILIIKLLLFVAMLVLSAFARETVFRLTWPATESSELQPDRIDIDPVQEVRGLRRTVGIEIIFALMVLVAAALLVNAVPARNEAASATPGAVGTTLRNAAVSVDLTATPGVAGRNDLHVDIFTPAGTPRDALNLTLTMALLPRHRAITVPLRRLGPGHYYAPGFDVPAAGRWRVEATPQLSELEPPTLRGSIEFG